MTPGAGPELPKDPAEYRRRPMLGVGFWAIMAFGVLSVLAGAAVAYLGPSLLPPKPTPPAPAAAVRAVQASPPVGPLPAETAAAGEVAGLRARIAALESEGVRSSQAAAAALAAAALVEASQGSRPFAGELTTLRAAAPGGLPELAALTRLSETGAPSRAALAASFPEFAARAASRARKPQDGAPLGDRIVYAASKVVTVRRVEPAAGSSPDAVLARAELALQEGDVVQALQVLDALPPKARQAVAPWRDQAERRAEIDRQVRALRSRALRELGAVEKPA
jgi:hypothetical protein